MTVTLHVCITCRAGLPVPDGEPVPGLRLLQALTAETLPQGVRIVPVECLSACANGAAIALSGPGRWTYVYGSMSADDAPEIMQGAAAYADASDGIVPWRERVTIFRKRSLARIPPIG
ncbi:DUF1636 domain-containing protein [Paracoccus kondratievae]|uniref:Metal-binding protein n=1 Tax=Paracoccus kondratievae TaxID=135740 RepID=A0AAD3NVI4_9RHOB|nr:MULTISPECIES: DUF1636 domain-containing protein [Paracoccus]QFQ86187.1 DUF1636 domain-containing protein [Paracoccus kondratievae]GLK62767.1 metal-binding protein [Paracoccus kondratievae]SMG14534.1 Predicted metal-binding protein [Paracoccus sp. J56]